MDHFHQDELRARGRSRPQEGLERGGVGIGAAGQPALATPTVTSWATGDRVDEPGEVRWSQGEKVGECLDHRHP